MKKYWPFLNLFDLELENSKAPLLIFKMGLATVVLIQVLGYILEAPLIFNNSGLFPDSLVQLYFPSGVFNFGEHSGLVLSFLLGALAVFSVFKKLQNLSFIGIFILELLFWIRNFTFLNFGDYSLLILSLFAALTPTATWPTRHEKIKVQEVLPLYCLSSVIYFMNGIFKLSSTWAQGSGLKETLSHRELARFPELSTLTSNFTFANYAAILTVFCISLAPWISVRHKKWRNGLILLSLSYHLAANLFMNLSWLSLPFILLQLTLWAPTTSEPAVAMKKLSLKRTQALALALVLLGFFGMRDPIGIYAFGEANGPLLGHNWYMFAPGPLMTGQWQALAKSSDKSVLLSQAELEEPFHFFYFQHKYKFFYNLRKTEMLPAATHFSTLLCSTFREKKQPFDSIQLIYSGHLFRTGEDFQVSYPTTACH